MKPAAIIRPLLLVLLLAQAVIMFFEVGRLQRDFISLAGDVGRLSEAVSSLADSTGKLAQASKENSTSIRALAGANTFTGATARQ